MVRERPSVGLLAGWLALFLAVALSGCTDVRAGYEEAQDAVGQMTDRTRFCLSLTRALTAIEATSPATAHDAIEEAVAQAPDDHLEDVRALADAVRAVSDQGADGLRDPELQSAADRLRERTRDLCDPV